MAKYRCLISQIRLGDKTFSKATGPFELPDNVAIPLLRDKKIAPVNAPMIPGVAEETVKAQDAEIADLKKQLSEKDAKILELSALLDKKEDDIDSLRKSQAVPQTPPAAQPIKK